MKNKRIASILSTALCIVLAFSLSACSFFFTTDKIEAETDKILSVPTLSDRTQDRNDTVVRPDIIDEPVVNTSIEEKTLYDDNDIVIKVVSQNIDESIFGPQIRLYMENNSDVSVVVQVRNESINGIMMDGLLSTEIKPGNKAYDIISFMQIDFTKANIDIIVDLELSFHIFDPETWNVLHMSPMVTIETSAVDTYIQEYDITGELLFNNEEIKIVMQGMDYSDDIYGPSIMLYIENNSEQNLTVQVLDFSINSYVFSPIFSCNISPNKIAYNNIIITESELDEIGIDKITDVEFIFHIYEPSTWDVYLDSEIIKLTFQ